MIIFPLTAMNVSPSEQRAGIVQRSTGAENLRLFNVVKFDSELTAISEGKSHRLRAMVKVDDHFIATVARNIFRNVTNQWLAQDWNCRFGAIFGQWPQTGAIAGGKNHCAHGKHSSRFKEYFAMTRILAGIISRPLDFSLRF